VAFGPKEEVERKIKSLNGRICLIRGNHDARNIERQGLRDRFHWIRNMWLYHATDGEDKIRIVLCHYPMLKWDRSHYGTWHLHGHCHGMLQRTDKALSIDVGCNIHNYTPLALDEVIWMFRKMEKDGYGPQRRNR
jgi:calcineurin-like phosphoesterase family protein